MATRAPRVILAIPCYNEEQRLQPQGFLALADADVGVLFVDDGSSDGTARVVDGLVQALGGRAELLRLGTNRGKAEAVRRGMLAALDRGADVVGYIDADFATPVDQVLRLVRQMDAGTAAVVMGARVALLGTRIERSAMRHYLGRVFATVASLVLRVRVYDTQCGAKVFRASPLLRDALSREFLSRWAFDVELLDRLLAGTPSSPALTPEDFLEVPLASWHDARGSKLRPTAMLRAGLDLLRLAFRRGRRAPQA